MKVGRFRRYVHFYPRDWRGNQHDPVKLLAISLEALNADQPPREPGDLHLWKLACMTSARPFSPESCLEDVVDLTAAGIWWSGFFDGMHRGTSLESALDYGIKFTDSLIRSGTPPRPKPRPRKLLTTEQHGIVERYAARAVAEWRYVTDALGQSQFEFVTAANADLILAFGTSRPAMMPRSRPSALAV